jgi:hypothetical protein
VKVSQLSAKNLKDQLVLQPVVVLTLIIPCQYFVISKKYFT